MILGVEENIGAKRESQKVSKGLSTTRREEDSPAHQEKSKSNKSGVEMILGVEEKKGGRGGSGHVAYTRDMASVTHYFDAMMDEKGFVGVEENIGAKRKEEEVVVYAMLMQDILASVTHYFDAMKQRRTSSSWHEHRARQKESIGA
jgi:hypothetical protein